MIAVVAVVAGCTMLVVEAATSFLLGVVLFAMTVVIAGSKMSTAEAITEV